MVGWARLAMGTASPTKQVRSSGVGLIGCSFLFFQAASAWFFVWPTAAGSGDSRFQKTLHALRFSASFNQDLTTAGDLPCYPVLSLENCFSSGFILRFYASPFPRFSALFRVCIRRRIPPGFVDSSTWLVR